MIAFDESSVLLRVQRACITTNQVKSLKRWKSAKKAGRETKLENNYCLLPLFLDAEHLWMIKYADADRPFPK